MSMWQDTRQLFRQLKQDPEAAGELRKLKGISFKTLGWLFLIEAVTAAEMYPSKYFFDGLVNHRSLHYLVTVVAIATALYILGTAMYQRMDVQRTSSYWHMWSFWWGYGHKRELELSTEWHIAHSAGEKGSQLEKNIYRVQRLVDYFLFVTSMSIARIAVTNVVVWLIDWRVGVLAMATTVIYILLVRRSEIKFAPYQKEFQQQIRHIEQHGTDLTLNWRTIKQFGLEQKMGDENWQSLLTFARAETRRQAIYYRFAGVQGQLLNVSRGLLYILLVLSYVKGGGVGNAVLMASLMERAYANYYQFSDFQRQLNEGGESLKELITLLSLTPTVRQPELPRWPNQLMGKITVQHVNFDYPNGRKGALKNVNLTINPGEMIALVGASGSGKTTLASLLMREFDPTSGSISIDELDLRELDLDQYRRKALGIVSQATQLFDETIAYNIGLGKTGANRVHIEEAARQAFAEEFIRQLPNGYDSKTGDNGVRLSGGQRQRIAIARALVKQPTILILDEATSALDAISQRRVQEAITELKKKHSCTIVVIAHRLSTIEKADRVVVMEDGQIQQIGTHEELMERQGLYLELQKLEAAGMLAGD